MKTSKKHLQQMVGFRAAGLSPAHAARLMQSQPGRRPLAMLLGGAAILCLAGAGVFALNSASRPVEAVAAAPVAEPAPVPALTVEQAAPEPEPEVVEAAVAPPPSPEPEVVETATVEPVAPPCSTRLVGLLKDAVFLFESGRTELDEFDAQTLSWVSAELIACPEARVQISGHSDSSGSDTANLDLSWRRAEAVLAALALSGVDVSRYEAVGFGARMPFAQGDDGADPLNRRVELRLLKSEDTL